MIRGAVPALLLTLCACGKERPDPRIGELTSPMHITVRVIDAPMEKDCEGAPLVERLQCYLTRAERQGCTYVEVGAAADKPDLVKAPDPRRCHFMDTSQHALLTDRPAKKATITLEASGRRALIELNDSVHAIYLREGEVVAHRKLWDLPQPGTPGYTPPPPADFSHVEPFLAVMNEELLLTMPEAELDALIAESPTGKTDLKRALFALSTSADLKGEGWARAVSKLSYEDRKELRIDLVDAVSNGTMGALEWFEAHPEEQGADFIDALVEAAEGEMFDLSIVLPRVLEHSPERAEKIACDHLERMWHEADAAYEYDYYPPSAAALAVLIKRKAKCQWVMPLLLRAPCGDELRCDPDADDDEPTPLCTPEQTDKALRHALDPELEYTDDELDMSDSEWGPLLVAAARQQGPLPPELLRAEARRHYKQLFTFKGREEDDMCRMLSVAPVDWACKLPLSITRAHYESCTIVLDDAKKTMTLISDQLDEDQPDEDPLDVDKE